MFIKYKKIILTGVGLLVLSGIIGGIFYWQNDHKPKSRNNAGEKAASTSKSAAGGDASSTAVKDEIKDVVKYNNNIYEDVLESGDNSRCADLIGDGKKDLCLKFSAVKQGEPDICASITDLKINSGCLDENFRNLAVKENNLDICEKISGADLKSACVMDIISKNCSLEKCEKLNGANKIICLDLFYFREAVDKSDFSNCDKASSKSGRDECYLGFFSGWHDLEKCKKLPADVKSVCEEFITANEKIAIADTDADGLSDEQEKIYGTDPKNPDTDKDGYLMGMKLSEAMIRKGREN